MHRVFLLVSTLILVLVCLLALLWQPVLHSLWILLPLFALGVYDMLQSRHSIRRNFPLVGRGRWVMEFFRPYIQQYLVEADTEGTPINRIFRSIVYQRAKDSLDSVPFGTRLDTYRVGYEWIGHSLGALDSTGLEKLPSVRIGGPDCRRPYDASILNISAMSFGALSRNAVLALNLGARQGGFAHNTGEGGISPYHLEHGGDLIWQIGTGYFGCRDAEGRFNEQEFARQAAHPAVRMIEIKLSQGAKPGHGGILPAHKNTPEIAAIRGVEPYTRVDSPPTHSAFSTPRELMLFIKRIRDLADGKPIGFKLAIGRQSEFVALCKAMVATGITPDFITVDGGEGGTGAAPLEYANSVGMPLRDALAFVDNCLSGFGLRQDIRIIAAGKIFSGFHLVKNLALGADLCNSARGMMLALGCVQSLTCHSNRCPTGITTQDPNLYRALVVEDKAKRVAQFQRKTVQATMEIIASAGLADPAELNRSHIHRRTSAMQVHRYDQIYPYMQSGALLREPPESYQLFMDEADADCFQPSDCLTTIDQKSCVIASDRQTRPMDSH